MKKPEPSAWPSRPSSGLGSSCSPNSSSYSSKPGRPRKGLNALLRSAAFISVVTDTLTTAGDTRSIRSAKLMGAPPGGVTAMGLPFCATTTGASDTLAASAAMSPAAMPMRGVRASATFIIRSLSLRPSVRRAMLKLETDPISATAEAPQPQRLLLGQRPRRECHLLHPPTMVDLALV